MKRVYSQSHLSQSYLKGLFAVGKSVLKLLFVVPLLAPGFSFADDESPFVIPKKDYRKQVKHVSLTPLTVAPGLTLSDEFRTLIEAEAANRLSKTRVELVPIEPYAEIRRRFIQAVGGITNEEGVILTGKQRLVWDHAKREMRHRYPVDSFAEISVRAVRANFSDDRAEWDGVKQKVQSSGDGFSLFGGKNYQGTIGALSFQLAVFSRNNELLFVNRGGIEVLQAREGSKLVVLPETALLQDPKKLKKAVQIAFKPL